MTDKIYEYRDEITIGLKWEEVFNSIVGIEMEDEEHFFTSIGFLTCLNPPTDNDVLLWWQFKETIWFPAFFALIVEIIKTETGRDLQVLQQLRLFW